VGGQRHGVTESGGEDHQLASGRGRRQDALAVRREIVAEALLQPEVNGRRPIGAADIDAEAVVKQERLAVFGKVGQTRGVEPGQVALGAFAGRNTHERAAFLVAREQHTAVGGYVPQGQRGGRLQYQALASLEIHRTKGAIRAPSARGKPDLVAGR
jgi:hypothetical protein